MGRRGSAINQHTGTGGMIMDQGRDLVQMREDRNFWRDKYRHENDRANRWKRCAHKYVYDRDVDHMFRLRTAYRSALEVIRGQAGVIKGLQGLVDTHTTRFYSENGELRFVDCCKGVWACRPVPDDTVHEQIGQEWV
jgi:hypothetical protein